MRFLRQSLTGLFLLSLTLGLLVYAGQIVVSAVQDRMSAEKDAPPRRERVFAVNVVEATADTVTPILVAYGQIQSRRILELRARSAGSVVELAHSFKEGGAVERGQVLARIDPTDADFALQRAQSELQDAKAEKREAEKALKIALDELQAARDQSDLRARAFQRQKDLETRGVGTTTSVEVAELAAAQARQAVLSNRRAVATAEARIDQSATRLARAQIAFDEAERRLADTVISAGFSGTLSDVSVVEGGFVSANERLATLVDGRALEVAFRVSTQQYARLLDDRGNLTRAPITVVLDVFGLQVEASGQISRESAATGEGQTGRLVFASIDNPRGMKPGDFVTVRIEEPALHDTVRLPASALDADNSVLVLNDEDRLETLRVTLLRRQGDDVLVRAGALIDRRVVAERTPLLGAGIKVRPVSELTEERAAAADMLMLSNDRRARLLAFVEASADMPEAVKLRLLDQLQQAQVPARMVERLERRMGG